MADEEEKLPAELRMKLLEAEEFKDYQQYPNWKRGIKFGLTGIFSAVFVVPIAYLKTVGSENTSSLVTSSLVVVLAIMIMAFSFGAFRPPR